MTDDTSSSPSKYDGYSAYLQSLSRSTINAIAQRQEQQQQQDERARDFSTPQKPPQRSNSRHEHDDSGSPPFTPSTPPPPPPLPAGTALSPRFGSLSPVGSFAEAVRPLASSASGESGGDARGVDTAKHEAHRQTPQDHEGDRNDDGPAWSDASSSDAPHWEDFMAHYWKLPSDDTLQIHAHAASIVQAEDVDLRPCPTEPQLDDEPFLSPIRTGCIDIDMDANTVLKSPSSSADAMDSDHPRVLSSPMKELSHVGLESTRIMAKLHGGEIREEAVSIATPVNASADVSYRRQTSHERFAAPSLSSSVSSFVPLSSPHSFDDRRSVASNTNTNHSTSSEPNHALPTTSHPYEIPTTSSQEWPHKISPLPSKTLIHALGPILTRTSLRSLVLKKWSPAYWMHYGPHTLLLFRTMEQLDDWRYNPYHGKRQREFLIKLRIDFYGEMVAGETREGGGGSGVLGHRILPVKRKSYGKNEMDMYQFKLERWTHLGVSVLAAFASQEEAEVQTLHDTISKILKSCPYGGLRNIDHMLKK